MLHLKRVLSVLVSLCIALPSTLVLAPAAHAAEFKHFCIFDEVAIMETRVHLRCHEAVPANAAAGVPAGLTYFAVDLKAQPVFAKAVVDACQDSVARWNGWARPEAVPGYLPAIQWSSWCRFNFWFDTNAAANPPGCLPRDCRKLVGIAWFS